MSHSSESIKVILRDLQLNPNCKHGPTILFSSNSKKFFSCSCQRDSECFRVDFEDFDEGKAENISNSVDKLKLDGLLVQEVQKMKDTDRIYCKSCEIFIANIQNHQSHKIIREISDEFLTQPSLHLQQLDNDKFNAQYFFDDTTLDFICSILDDLKLTKVICLGAPRLHDFIRASRPNFNSILLDIDGRFRAFNKPGEFLQYNMFNNYFFGGAEDEENFTKFLKDPELNRSSHVLFTDPPFAARTELLTYNLRSISKLFNKVNAHFKILPILWIFPYFNEQHIRREMPEMEMLDFQVTYMNHKTYSSSYKGRKAGSPIRIFTNIDPSLIRYPEKFSNYRFCKPCAKFVALNNAHCKICKKCPSKNGSTYRHCQKCVICVKPNYSHCDDCGRCVQKNSHDCKIYQQHQECWLCGQFGHVEIKCENSKKKLKRQRNGSCSLCGKMHNLRVCDKK